MRSGVLPVRFWLTTGAAVVGISLTMVLGFWQLSRAAEKLALQSAIDEAQARPALDTAALLRARDGAGSLVDVVYRNTRLRGTWLGRHTVFLDNRQMNGKPGFFVLTPLLLENSSATIMVQRGWVQRSFNDRATVPKVPTPPGLVEVAGRIAPPPSKLYEFESSRGGAIRQNLDMREFSREIGAPLLDVSVLQLAPAEPGLQRDWLRVNTGIDKHYGYAFQWFALCGLLVILYGWFQIVRRFISPR